MEISGSLNRGPGERSAESRKRGFGKPFQKGQSGNPGGRPRKVKPVEIERITRGSIHDMLRAGALCPVLVEVDGRTVEIAALEAGAREVALKAATGDRMALTALTRLIAATEPEALPEEPDDPDDWVRTLEENAKRWTELNDALRRAQRELAEARERGFVPVEAGNGLAMPPAPREPEESTVMPGTPEHGAAPKVDEPAPDREAVREAMAYRDICAGALEEVAGTDIDFPALAPHPRQVIVDARTLRYTVALEPGQGATIANLRKWLTRLHERVQALQDYIDRSRLLDHRYKLECKQAAIERMCGRIERGLAQWDARGDGA